MNSRYKIIFIIIIILGAAAWYFTHAPEPVAPMPEPVVVEPTPVTTSETDGWLTQISGDAIFKYPAELGTTYIHTQDWPPVAEVLDEPYECTEAGTATERAGKTETIMVSGHEYCKTTVSEGAAGSTYNQYAFAKDLDGKTVTLTFTIKQVQCGNYDEPLKTECETERASFDMDKIIDQMFGTLLMN